jgi:hypothetical protein
LCVVVSFFCTKIPVYQYRYLQWKDWWSYFLPFSIFKIISRIHIIFWLFKANIPTGMLITVLPGTTYTNYAITFTLVVFSWCRTRIRHQSDISKHSTVYRYLHSSLPDIIRNINTVNFGGHGTTVCTKKRYDGRSLHI